MKTPREIIQDLERSMADIDEHLAGDSDFGNYTVSGNNGRAQIALAIGQLNSHAFELAKAQAVKAAAAAKVVAAPTANLTVKKSSAAPAASAS